MWFEAVSQMIPDTFSKSAGLPYIDKRFSVGITDPIDYEPVNFGDIQFIHKLSDTISLGCLF